MGSFLYVLAFIKSWSHSKIIFVARVIHILVQTAQTETNPRTVHFEKSYLTHFNSESDVFYMYGKLSESIFI